MCAYRNNLASLRSTVNHLASIGCTSLHVGCVNAMGEWVHNAGTLTPTFEEYLEAVLGYGPAVLRGRHAPALKEALVRAAAGAERQPHAFAALAIGYGTRRVEV